MAQENEVLVRIKAVLDDFRQGFKEGMADAKAESAKTAAAIEKDFSGLKKSVEGFGQGITKLGQGMSVALTAPLALIAKQSISDFGEAAKAVADVEAAIKSTGGTAGKTLDELKASADKLQWDSLFADEEILKSLTANLLTFKNISGDTFDRTQQAAIDMSARLGQDLKSSAMQLGKALNDPVKGMSALSRVGIQFTEDQKKMIEGLVESGDLLGAQAVILKEVESQFAGAAAAARDAGGLGDFADFDTAMGELRESIGGILVEFITPFVQKLTELVNWFRTLSPEAQRMGVMIAGIVAVAGPLLAILGPIITAFAGLAPVIAALASPVGLVIAAIAGISIVLNEMGITFAQQWEAVKIIFQGVITFFQQQIQLFKQLITGDFAGAFQTIQEMFANWSKTVLGVIEALFPGLIEYMTTGFQNLITLVSTKITELVTWFQNLSTQVIEIVSGMVTAITDKLVGGLQYAWDAVANGLQGVKDAFQSAYMFIVGGSVVPDMVNEIGENMKTLEGANLVDPAKKATDEVASLFSGLADTVKSYISDFIKTGKFDIEGFMADISGKLIDWGLDMIFKNLLGGMGGGTGGGLLGGLLGFAEGGKPPLNKPSWVGENGPELFIPNSRGTIIPSKQSREMINGASADAPRRGNMGGGNTWNVNVYPRDVDSFRRSESSVGRTMRKQAELGQRGA